MWSEEEEDDEEEEEEDTEVYHLHLLQFCDLRQWYDGDHPLLHVLPYTWQQLLQGKHVSYMYITLHCTWGHRRRGRRAVFHAVVDRRVAERRRGITADPLEHRGVEAGAEARTGDEGNVHCHGTTTTT